MLDLRFWELLWLSINVILVIVCQGHTKHVCICVEFCLKPSFCTLLILSLWNYLVCLLPIMDYITNNDLFYFSGFFLFTYVQGLSMLQHVSIFHCFLWPNNILHFVHQVIDIWVIQNTFYQISPFNVSMRKCHKIKYYVQKHCAGWYEEQR